MAKDVKSKRLRRESKFFFGLMLSVWKKFHQIFELIFEQNFLVSNSVGYTKKQPAYMKLKNQQILTEEDEDTRKFKPYVVLKLSRTPSCLSCRIW